MFLSWQTYKSLEIIVQSIIELTKYLLSEGVSQIFLQRDFAKILWQNYLVDNFLCPYKNYY